MTERGKRINKLIGWVILLLGAVILAGAVADSKVGDWLRPPNQTVVPASLAGIHRVSVRTDTMQVRIQTEDRSDLTVTVHGSHAGWVDTRLTRSGSELQVRVSAPWWHHSYKPEPITVDIRLPNTFTDVLAIDAGEGSLSVSGPANLQTLDLKVGTAKVELQAIRAGRLAYKGETGALLADQIQADQADLKLVTGQISLSHFAGALHAQLTAGLLETTFDSLTGPVTVNADTGKLVLALPPDAGFTLDAKVGRGIIHKERTLSQESGAGANTWRGAQGAGTYPVDLRLSTGEITVR